MSKTRPIAAMLDITADKCPVTFAKTKLKLEEMAVGEILEVLISHRDTLRNLPRSVEGEGHKVLEVTPVDENFRVLIEKGDPYLFE